MSESANYEILDAVVIGTARPWDTLEELLVSEWGFGLVTATPLQIAICRIADGTPLGDLADHPDVIAYIGDVSGINGIRPKELALFTGIRTFKSMLAAAIALHASQTCKISHLGRGEIPRVSVVSLTIDLAAVIHQHVVGCLSSDRLGGLLLCDPTADLIVVKHPTGRPVEIKTVAGSKAGVSLVARWSAGCIFEEASRMVGADEGVVNYDDCHHAVKGRLLEGAQIMSIGSPWAPRGPAWRIVNEHWKKPTVVMVCIKAPAWVLNPYWWTRERLTELEKEDPDVYRTDAEAEFLEPEESMYSSTVIDGCMRASRTLEPTPGWSYGAAMDPATRSNDWTLVVAGKGPDGRKSVVFTKRWQGSKAKPLSPDTTAAEVAGILKPYNVGMVHSDEFSGDALRDIFARYDVVLVIHDTTAGGKVEDYTQVKTEMSDGKMELAPDPYLRSDLLAVKRRVTSTGIAIVLPKTADGRHCDFAPALVMVMVQVLPEYEKPIPKPGTRERADYEEKRMEDWDDEQHQATKQWW